MIPEHFGEGKPFTVGIEEELFCVDRETLEPRAFPRGALDGTVRLRNFFVTEHGIVSFRP